MKLFIIEGGDNLGKSTLIKRLCGHFNYDNVTIRHFGKPPKDLSPAESDVFQFNCFHNEANLVYEIQHVFCKYKYHYYPETIIWNRSHLGEFVYAQMFRNGDPKILKDKLLYFEKFYLNKVDNVYLITLSADPEFFLEKEDGLSFSKTLEEKTKELELFKEAHDFSLIENKILIKVDKGTEISTGTEWRMKGLNMFRPKEDIFNEVLNFINT